MLQVYQQIILDKNSDKFIVINPLWFIGVYSATGILQRTVEMLLKGITGVVVYLDDILVTGGEHLEHLEETLLTEARLKPKNEKCAFLQNRFNISDT